MKKFCLACLMTMLLGLCPVYAQDGPAGGAEFKQGLAAYKRADYDGALSHFSRGDEQGNADCQYYLGLMLQEGNGVMLDEAEAVRYFAKAAQNGQVDAMYSLGMAYGVGTGVERNIDKSILWLQKAAEQGHSRAYRELMDL